MLGRPLVRLAALIDPEAEAAPIHQDERSRSSAARATGSLSPAVDSGLEGGDSAALDEHPALRHDVSIPFGIAVLLWDRAERREQAAAGDKQRVDRSDSYRRGD